jgi:hypothetical protein
MEALCPCRACTVTGEDQQELPLWAVGRWECRWAHPQVDPLHGHREPMHSCSAPVFVPNTPYTYSMSGDQPPSAQIAFS